MNAAFIISFCMIVFNKILFSWRLKIVGVDDLELKALIHAKLAKRSFEGCLLVDYLDYLSDKKLANDGTESNNIREDLVIYNAGFPFPRNHFLFPIFNRKISQASSRQENLQSCLMIRCKIQILLCCKCSWISNLASSALVRISHFLWRAFELLGSEDC